MNWNAFVRQAFDLTQDTGGTGTHCLSVHLRRLSSNICPTEQTPNTHHGMCFKTEHVEKAVTGRWGGGGGGGGGEEIWRFSSYAALKN